MTHSKLFRSLIGLALVFVLAGGGMWYSPTVENPLVRGTSMGTTYSIRITAKMRQKKVKALARRVDLALAEVNHQMSTWMPESDIIRFNRSQSTAPVPVPAQFAEVARRALELAEASDGALDPTLHHLLNAWGFGSEGHDRRVPTDRDIRAALQQTGWEKLSIQASGTLQKSEPSLSLALGALAKGYGVDVVAEVLNAEGFENWFIEIGGEVAVRGRNTEGAPWKIGIQNPVTDGSDLEKGIRGIVHLTQGALATSGGYRNYIERDGTIYAHILDPRTGKSVLSNTASVSVLSATCMDADGIATALYVMGPSQGLAWVESLPGVEAMFVVWNEVNGLEEVFSSGFEAKAGYEPLQAITEWKHEEVGRALQGRRI